MRTHAAAQRQALEVQSGPDALIAFLTIEHPGLADPIRVVCDVLPYSLGGVEWTPLIFGHRLLTDGEGAARTQLVIQNTDRRIGQALRRAQDRARVHLELRSSADFDLTVVPRVEADSNPPIYAIRDFELINISASATEITGDVQLADYSTEPCPHVRATQDRMPGLFR